MEIIDFNPYTIRRRLSTEVEVETETRAESGPTLASGDSEAVAKDQDDENMSKSTEDFDCGEVIPGGWPYVTLDPKNVELESRSGIVIDPPFQIPCWIPSEDAVGCNLPYTSYEIPIPVDLNMDFCIDVMMGQDTIVFMFVCGARSSTPRVV